MKQIQDASTDRWSFDGGGIALAVLSAGAAAAHFAVMGAHFKEYWLFGLFFALLAWYQVLWALAIFAKPSRLVLWAGALVNLTVVGVWVVSRTAGLPIGPNPGIPEAKGTLDIITTIFEALIVMGAFAWLVRGAKSMSPRWLGVAVALVVLPLTISGLIIDARSGGHHHAASAAGIQKKTVTTALGSIEGYLDPPVAGASELHLTFFDTSGTELKVDKVVAVAKDPEGTSTELEMTRFSEGHFVTQITLKDGKWSFEVTGSSVAGQIGGTFTQVVA
ncbi:MAG: hypothetical protein ABR507_02740 [Actinomycetota bacterium]|nr:hypothetical protein [Actinomycetota bacterium]